MLVVNYSTLVEKMETLFDKVTNDYEVLTVTGKNNANVVILSEETYHSLLEKAYICSDKANYEWLIESKNQYTNQNLKELNIIENKSFIGTNEGID